MVVLTILSATLVESNARLSVRLSPAVLQAGQSLWLTCRISRHPDNRAMAYGLIDADGVAIDNQGREVHGNDGPVTFQRAIPHAPCGAVAAYCVVKDRFNQQEQETAPLIVAGCDAPHEL
jgi:hypothetical protein